MLDILYSKFCAATSGFRRCFPLTVCSSPAGAGQYDFIAHSRDMHTTGTTEMGIVVESFPEVINRSRARLCPSVYKKAKFGLAKVEDLETKNAREIGLTFRILPTALNIHLCELTFFWFFALTMRIT